MTIQSSSLVKLVSLPFKFILFSALLLFAILLPVLLRPSPSFAQEEAVPGEIIVTAAERYWVGADSVRITTRLETTGKSALEAQAALEQTAASLETAAKNLGEVKKSLRRGEGFVNAADKNAPISNSSAVRAERYLAFEIYDKSKTGTLIDTLLKAGASEITEVEYLAPAESEAHEVALEKAAKLAQNKAEKIAKTLGVSLGRVISASSAEEPLGASLRKQLQQGIPIERYSERDSSVYLTVRYEVLNASQQQN